MEGSLEAGTCSRPLITCCKFISVSARNEAKHGSHPIACFRCSRARCSFTPLLTIRHNIYLPAKGIEHRSATIVILFSSYFLLHGFTGTEYIICRLRCIQGLAPAFATQSSATYAGTVERKNTVMLLRVQSRTRGRWTVFYTLTLRQMKNAKYGERYE